MCFKNHTSKFIAFMLTSLLVASQIQLSNVFAEDDNLENGVNQLTITGNETSEPEQETDSTISVTPIFESVESAYDVSVTNYTGLNNSIQNLTSGETIKIEVANDFNFLGTINISGSKTVIITGSSVLYSAGLRHFNLTSGAKLVIYGITLDGRTDSSGTSARAGGINVDNSIFEMNSGAINWNYADRGGGIYGTNNSIITINDGLISHNSTNTGANFYSGGGIYATSSIVNINGGLISQNYSRSSGGGIYAESSSTINMNGGTISDNTTSGYGGGIGVSGYVYMEITGGTINDNIAKASGGGLSVNGDSTLNMISVETNDITINKNIADYLGGGISTDNSTITIHGDTANSIIISENTANANGTSQDYYGGGGIYAFRGSNVTISGVTISGNTANYGGGIWALRDSHIIINGSTDDVVEISGNNSTYYGGGIYTMTDDDIPSTVKMNGGTICNNSSQYGGGISAYTNSIIEINGGTINDNVANGPSNINGFAGGAIYSISSTVKMNGGTIRNNSAQYGGGIEVYYNSNLQISSGEIYNNNAWYGAGIHASNDSPITINGLNIHNNTATEFGGGICTGNSDVVINGQTENSVTISGNTSGRIGGGIYSTSLSINGEVENSVIISNNFATGSNDGDGGGGIYVPQLENLYVSNGVKFSENKAAVAYYLTDTSDKLLHTSNITMEPKKYSEPPQGEAQFDYGYNNFDINYNKGAPYELAFNVTFNSNNGTNVNNKIVKYLNLVEKPMEPTKTGYTFSGWYIDDGTFNSSWDFDSAIVTSNVTLYAKWIINEYVVTFDSKGGSSVVSQKVKYNDKVAKPTNPTLEDFNFVDWYSDANYTTVWNFENSVNSNITLYAKWISKEYTVMFDTNGGEAVESLRVPYGSLIKQPLTTRSGYTFNGWYADSKLWEFDIDKVTHNVTLTANWTPNVSPVNPNIPGSSSNSQAKSHTPEDTIVINEAQVPKGMVETNSPTIYKQLDENDTPIGYFTPTTKDDGKVEWVEVTNEVMPLSGVSANKANPKTRDVSKNFKYILILLTLFVVAKIALIRPKKL